MTDSLDLQKRYGLRRPNFLLNPLSDEDAEFFADRSDVNVGNIVDNLQIDLATGVPPKRLLWGPYGGGKTHTLLHTMKRLARLTPVHPIYVECPDLSKRATFLDLYREGIMRALSQDFVLDLFEKTRDKVGYAKREELLRKLKESLLDEELAKAVAILIDPTEQKRLLLWSWFSGVTVPRSDLADLGQTQDLSNAEPARLAQYLSIVGKLVKELENRTLIIILDEIDRLRAVGVETIVQFQTAFTRLMDPNQKHVAILVGLSAQNLADLPEVFQERTPVTSRLGKDAILQINYLDDVEVESFIKKIVNFIRDPQAPIDDLLKQAKASTNEMVDAELFPFTEEAIQALKLSLGREMTPREITLKMTRAAGKAHNHGKPVISEDVFS